MKPCPCGSKKTYFECCHIFITGKIPAPTPETLMRSRYTAYSEANIDYIEATMKGRALENFDKEDAKKWAENVQWLGLEVIRSKLKGTKGYVEFIARFEEQDQERKIHEISEFKRENERWYYVDGVTTASN